MIRRRLNTHPPSDLDAEGWSTKDGDKDSGSSIGDYNYNPYLSDSDKYNHPHWQGNILFNDLAEGLNAIVNGLNDSDNKHSPDLRLRKTYISMLWEYNSTFSLGKLQAAAARCYGTILSFSLI